ncbi:MAG: acyl-CoA dehydrogenase family protein [Lachnospiraceae bacterium]
MIFTEEQKEIQALVHTFAEKEIRPISKKYDELGEFPMELYKKACRMQLNCLDLPAEYGGTGVSKVTSCLIREELSWGRRGLFPQSRRQRPRVQAASHSGDGAPAKALCRGAAERRLHRLRRDRARRRLRRRGAEDDGQALGR